MSSDTQQHDTGSGASGSLRYRLLTGPDDHAFCVRVSDALAEGWQLYGSPAIARDGETNVVTQAVVWPD